MRGRQQLTQALAQRGLSGSGIGTSLEAMLRGVQTRGGIQTRAEVEAQNQAARDEALASLGRFDLLSDEYLLKLAGVQTNLGLARAGFEADVPLTQFDYYQAPALAEAREAYERELEALDQIRAQLDEESGTSLGDLATKGLSMIGTGVLSNPFTTALAGVSLLDDLRSMREEAASRS